MRAGGVDALGRVRDRVRVRARARVRDRVRLRARARVRVRVRAVVRVRVRVQGRMWPAFFGRACRVPRDMAPLEGTLTATLVWVR